MKFKGHSDVIDVLAIYTTLFHFCYSYDRKYLIYFEI